jgi:hypothetical protein
MRIKNEFQILEEIVLTVDKIGIEKTVEIIRKARDLAKDNDIVIQEFIIQQVCNAFSITKMDLFEGKGNIDRTNALAIISVEMKNHLGYSQGRIAGILRKHDSVISKYIKRISYLDDNHIEDKRLIQKFDIVDINIKEFKNKLIE